MSCVTVLSQGGTRGAFRQKSQKGHARRCQLRGGQCHSYPASAPLITLHRPLVGAAVEGVRKHLIPCLPLQRALRVKELTQLLEHAMFREYPHLYKPDQVGGAVCRQCLILPGRSASSHCGSLQAPPTSCAVPAQRVLGTSQHVDHGVDPGGIRSRQLQQVLCCALDFTNHAWDPAPSHG